jgi:transposase
MIHLPAGVRVYLCLSSCDMLRSFDGLHALMRDHLRLDAFAGHLYLFANKRKDPLKILYWDRDGFAIWAKRLERGCYAIPSGEVGASGFEITIEELGALLSGIDLNTPRAVSGTAARVNKTFPLLPPSRPDPLIPDLRLTGSRNPARGSRDAYG